MAPEAREFDQAFIRLGAGVAKENLSRRAKAGAFGQSLREARLVLVIVEVRDVDELASLLADRLGHARMAMAQSDDCDAAEKIEIVLAVGVPDAGTLATHQRNARRVGVHDELFVQRNDVGVVHGAKGNTAQPAVSIYFRASLDTATAGSYLLGAHYSLCRGALCAAQNASMWTTR